MKLHEFRDQQKTEMDDFFYWWYKQHQKKTDNHPLDLEHGEWLKQFTNYIATKGK